MTGLKGLLLHNNNLTFLPPAIRRLAALTTLTLAANNLTYPEHPMTGMERKEHGEAFPEDWCKDMTSLASVDLSRNRLGLVPPGVCQLGRSMRRLILDANSLEALPEFAATALPSLQVPLRAADHPPPASQPAAAHPCLCFCFCFCFSLSLSLWRGGGLSLRAWARVLAHKTYKRCRTPAFLPPSTPPSLPPPLPPSLHPSDAVSPSAIARTMV